MGGIIDKVSGVVGASKDIYMESILDLLSVIGTGKVKFTVISASKRHQGQQTTFIINPPFTYSQIAGEIDGLRKTINTSVLRGHCTDGRNIGLVILAWYVMTRYQAFNPVIEYDAENRPSIVANGMVYTYKL